MNRSLLSPLLGDLANLLPTLTQVWPKLVHVFQGFGPDLPEAGEALELAAEFIRAQAESSQ
jgi:hypothetical protein